MLGDGTSWNYFYYVALHFEELCFRGHGLGVCCHSVRTQCSIKSTWQAQAQAEVNGVLPLLKMKPGFQPWCQRGSFPPSSSSATGTGCMLSLSHACHKYSSTNLVTSKLNYCNTLLAELRARLLSTACSEHGSTCAQPCEPAGTHHTTLHSPRCQPPKCQVDFKLALLDFKALNNKGSGYD